MITEDTPLFITRDESCRKLKCSLATLDKLISRKEIHAYSNSEGKTSPIHVSSMSIARFISKGGCLYKAQPDMTLEQFLSDKEGM